MQNTSVLLFITLFSRLFFVFTLILPTEKTLEYVLFCNSVMYFLVGVSAFVYIFLYRKIIIVVPETRTMMTRFRDGADLFISSLGVYFYTNINTVFVSSLLPPQFVAVYSVAEKVYRGAASLFSPINRALYPILLKLHSSNKYKFSRLFAIVYLFQMVSVILLSIILHYFDRTILKYFFHGNAITDEAMVFFSHFLYLSVLFVVSAYTTYILVIFSLDKVIKKDNYYVWYY